MPRRRRTSAAEFLDDAIETAVDTVFDRAAGAFEQFRSRAVQEQQAALPPEYLAQTFRCAACKQSFPVEQMEQVHPSNGWGTCKGCYAFMYKAGVEKAKQFAKRAAKAGARRATGQQPPPGNVGFQPPPPPSGPPPWEVLGVKQDAGVDEIKKAYRKKAMLYHPDRVAPGAPSEEKERAKMMFQTVTRAYDVMMKVRQAPE